VLKDDHDDDSCDEAENVRSRGGKEVHAGGLLELIKAEEKRHENA
jgi:hypothetical protein